MNELQGISFEKLVDSLTRTAIVESLEHSKRRAEEAEARAEKMEKLLAVAVEIISDEWGIEMPDGWVRISDRINLDDFHAQATEILKQ